MHLNDVHDVLTNNPSLGAEIIKSVEVKKIFHLVTGRNAWHSTWVRQYYKKSMSTESRDLENDAEKRREAGTTFQIDEIPALCLELPSGCLLITEINTLHPFKNYNPKYITKDIKDCNSKKLSEKSIFTGNTLANVLQSLNINEFWQAPKKENSLFLLYVKDLRPSDLEEATQKYASRVSGTSGSRKNSLAWNIKIGNQSDEFFRKLVNT
jgi:hypothetical protein